MTRNTVYENTRNRYHYDYIARVSCANFHPCEVFYELLPNGKLKVAHYGDFYDMSRGMPFYYGAESVSRSAAKSFGGLTLEGARQRIQSVKSSNSDLPNDWRIEFIHEPNSVLDTGGMYPW